VLSGPGGWYIVADDLDKGERRYFRLDRLGMPTLRSQDPAPEPLDDDAGLDALNPLSWAVDPPLHAVVVHDRRAAPLVQRLLGDPVETIERPEGTATTVRVTNRAAFIDGVLQAGEHVRLESPDALRGLLGDRLRSVAGGAR
jgi:predicted DNA-binding transcriptional regulator YafY